ncbi:hypothetical protein [Glaciecola sp. 33A]|uniref:hypothetical protein n=1 Tax=Glaciecola sp. 33A TaxID=2057807 RepID=UPI000C31D4DE|nr:hypothetical protein [Glaciecola sp. 33A]PKI00278.1 hypothetical protein CXF81_19215 [Glaciecola sp. 33A]
MTAVAVNLLSKNTTINVQFFENLQKATVGFLGAKLPLMPFVLSEPEAELEKLRRHKDKNALMNELEENYNLCLKLTSK